MDNLTRGEVEDLLRYLQGIYEGLAPESGEDVSSLTRIADSLDRLAGARSDTIREGDATPGEILRPSPLTRIADALETIARLMDDSHG